MNESDVANVSAVVEAIAAVVEANKAVVEAKRSTRAPSSAKDLLVSESAIDISDNEAVVVAVADNIESSVDEAKAVIVFPSAVIDFPKHCLPPKHTSPTKERLPLSSIDNASTPF
jgi:hypothetical protein